MLPGGIVKRGGVPLYEGGVVDDPAKRLLQVLRCCAGERLEFVIAARELSVGRTQRRRVPHGDVAQGPVRLLGDAALLARPRQALPAHRLLPHRGGTAHVRTWRLAPRTPKPGRSPLNRASLEHAGRLPARAVPPL